MPDLRTLALELATKALDLAGPEPHTGTGRVVVPLPEDCDAGVAVFKALEAQRYTLGVAYPALKADIGVAVDGHQDFATAAVVEKAAWGYLADHRQVGLLHFTEDGAAGTVVESYVYRGPDWVVKAVDGSEQTIVAGDWLLGTVWTPAAWNTIVAGDVDGLSFVGAAQRRPATAATVATLRH